MPHIGVVAGELSGDALGGGLLAEFDRKPLTPQDTDLRTSLRFSGITGPAMQRAGCQSICSIDQLSVMGFSDVFRALPRIYFGVYRKIFQHFLEDHPDLFIGIDAPDFNLRLAGKLKKVGIQTVQYVSPTLWAWRESRIKLVKKNIDHMLVVLPFEQDFYDRHGVAATYVGHPLADQIPLEGGGSRAFQLKLGLSVDRQYIALLPGSRAGEIKALLPDFLATARLCAKKKKELEFLIPAANVEIAAELREKLEHFDDAVPIRVFNGQSHDVIRASQCVLTASGTAALETMLLKRPMVVAYRLTGLSYFIAKRLVTARYFSLPNILANDSIVPEFLQERIDPQAMASKLLSFLDHAGDCQSVLGRFTEIHQGLRCDSFARSADQVKRLLARQ